MKMSQLRNRIKEAGIFLSTIADAVGISKQHYNQIMHHESGEKDNLKLTLEGLKIIHQRLGKLIHDVAKAIK